MFTSYRAGSVLYMFGRIRGKILPDVTRELPRARMYPPAPPQQFAGGHYGARE
jgi:hypothetical protein